MTNIKLKKNKGPAQYEAKGFRSGFVILFAVVISSIILSITLGVANVALKEVKFGTSAKETNYSFFAADSGIECALFNDKPTIGSPPVSHFPLPVADPIVAVDCASSTPTFSGDATSGIYTFYVTELGTTGINCAKVTVQKSLVGGVGPDISTIVIAKGYNVGGGSSTCSSSASNRIEREIKVTY